MIRSILFCIVALTAATHYLDAQSSLTLSVGGETPPGSEDAAPGNSRLELPHEPSPYQDQLEV